MAVRNWEKDFRSNAVTTSVGSAELLQAEDPFALPLSFCLPISQQAMNYWNPFTFLGICLMAFIGILIAGAVSLPLKAIDAMPPGMEANLWSAFIIGLMIFAFSVIVAPLICWEQIIKQFIGQRGRSLLGLAEKSGSKIVYAYIVDPDEFNPNKIPEDFVMVLIDPTEKRLVIEGTTARYQIRKQDIRKVKPFQLHVYKGAKISYSVTNQQQNRHDIEILIVQVSVIDLLAHELKVLWFLRRFRSETLLDNLEAAGIA